MVFRLVLKYIRAFGMPLTLFLIGIIIFNSFMAMNDRSGSYWLFVLITSGAVSMIIPAFFGLEKKYNGELLSISLPTTRKQIIYSYFLMGGFLSIIGCVFIYIAGFILRDALQYNDIFVFTDPIMIFIIITYFSMFTCITILFSSAIKNFIWLIIADVVFLIVFILGLEKIIIPNGIAVATNTSLANVLLLSIWASFLIIILLVSYKYSVKNYYQMDI